jgi:hypothetical protein
MKTFTRFGFIFALTIVMTCGANSQPLPVADVLPDSIGQWQAEGPATSYDRHTIFDYLDGGAEVYLAYGMVAATSRRYTCPGGPPIEASIFTMEAPDGAFGVFTYERMDADAGIGQGSEYGGGILRFWQGHTFVFIQAGSETPGSHDALFALGRHVATHLGEDATPPDLIPALPLEGLRPLTVRYALSPSILKNIEPTLNDNPLGLPQGLPAVFARYGRPGDPLRMLVARCADTATAREGTAAYIRLRSPRGSEASHPFRGNDGWSIAGTAGQYAILVLDAPDAERARSYFNTIVLTVKELSQ